MKVNAYLYPNPPLEGETLVNLWGDKFKMKNKPFLELEFIGFKKGKYEIEISEPIKIRKQITIKKEIEKISLFSKEFENPKLSKICVKIKSKKFYEEYELNLRVHKIYGRVTDFDNNPLSAYLWHKTIVKADENGKFVFYYPEGKILRLFVCDNRYSKETLECWIVCNFLRSDLKINPKVGNFEIYDLNVWFSANYYFAFFIPASLRLLKLEKELKWKKTFPPILKKDEVKVFINEKEMEIKNFIEIPTKWKVYWPSYLLWIKSIRHKKPTIFRVLVDSEEKGIGEAYYILYETGYEGF